MNFNTSPIAFYTGRAAQPWRASFFQNKVCVVTGDNLPPFIITDAPNTAPDTVEIYNAYDDTLASTRTGITDILAHTATIDGRSVNAWIYQGTSAGIFGFTTAGYYYLKIGGYYSDVIKFGEVVGDYVKLTWQFFDDIITVDGSLISKYVEYQQIFETILWHPQYNVTEEGKENNGVFYATQQTTKKTCGFSTLVNEAQVDCLNLTRMADIVNIESRTNGVVKNYQTNTFEIKSKWESDDTASIDCEFDLFNIIRKYQISNEKPEPLPIPTPPPTPSNYYIKGTTESGVNSIKLNINGTTETISVVNREFTFGYDTPIISLRTSTSSPAEFDSPLQNVDKITKLDLSQADGLGTATEVKLNALTKCTEIDLGNSTLASVTSVEKMFAGNQSMTTLKANSVTLAAATSEGYMFNGCKSLASLSMPNAVLKVGCKNMFKNCESLKVVNLPLATFEDSTSASEMFYGCKKLNFQVSPNLTLTSATFASCTSLASMFEGSGDTSYAANNLVLATILPALAAQPSSIASMFARHGYNSLDLQGLDTTNTTSASKMFSKPRVTHFFLDMDSGALDSVANLSFAFEGWGMSAYNMTWLDAQTFAGATNTQAMFADMVRIGSTSATEDFELSSATFAASENTIAMFKNAPFITISLPSATFANSEDAEEMFYQCANATEIDLSATTFASLISATAIFNGCAALETLTVPNSATMPVSFSLTQAQSLTIDTFELLVEWLKDMSGDTQQHMTISPTLRTMWQIMPDTQARYNAALAIMTGKNWTF